MSKNEWTIKERPGDIADWIHEGDKPIALVFDKEALPLLMAASALYEAGKATLLSCPGCHADWPMSADRHYDPKPRSKASVSCLHLALYKALAQVEGKEEG